MRWLKKINREKLYWHKWFAWYPVSTEMNQMAWLEYVERRKIIDDYWCDWAWTYRTRQEVKK